MSCPNSSTPTITLNPTLAADPRYIEFQEKIKTLEDIQVALKEDQVVTEKKVTMQEKKLNILETALHSLVSFLRTVFPFLKQGDE